MNRRRTVAAVLTIAVHIGFALLLLNRRPDPPMSVDTTMQVSLVTPWAQVRPPEPPAPAPRPLASARRTPPPILHRPVDASPPPHDVAPAPLASPPRAAPSPPPPAAGDAGAAALQRVLKQHLGCANPNLAGLSEAERADCDQRLGKDLANVRAYPVISPKLKKAFDGTFECKPDDEWCLYRMGKGPYPGLLALGRKKKDDWD